MSDLDLAADDTLSGPVVVTGANGFVGSHVCRDLAARGVDVVAVVRRAGTAPTADTITEHVGDFDDPDVAATVVDGAAALVTTVAPMGADHATQHEVSVDGTLRIAVAARDAGVARLVHVSTAAVYDRSPDVGDVDETSALVGDDAGAYSVTKRDADAALAEVDGITRILVRPPAILGPGETSVWNTLRPQAVREDPEGTAPNPDKTLAWIHVTDLAALLADLAVGAIPAIEPHADAALDPDAGPLAGGMTVVNCAAPDLTWRDWATAVADGLGIEPHWSDEPAWTGHLAADRARAWGWQPDVDGAAAMAELREGLATGTAT